MSRYDSAVLIAGAGHVRKDRGVAALLARLRPRQKVVELAFAEVSDDADQPYEYADAFAAPRLPFDYVWFTPRENMQDPCERFKKQLEDRLGARAAPSQ